LALAPEPLLDDVTAVVLRLGRLHLEGQLLGKAV
jgi:hypothetical protein